MPVGSILRGPGALLILLVLIAGGTAAAHQLSSGGGKHPVAGKHLRSGGAKKPVHAVPPAPTHHPVKKPVRRAPKLGALALQNRPAFDVHTGMTARLIGTQVDPAGKGYAWLMVEVELSASPGHSAMFSHRNFYAVAPNGQTYAAVKGDRRVRWLSTHLLPGGASRRAWIAFRVARSPMPMLIIWNDYNHYVPPAYLGVYDVRPASAIPTRGG